MRLFYSGGYPNGPVRRNYKDLFKELR